jgi:transglutaminase-like putative cysteine protease
LPLLVMLLVPIVTLYASTQGSPLLPACMLLLVLTLFVPWRVDGDALVWALRLVGYLAAAFTAILNTPENVSSAIDLRWTNAIGAVCAAEVTLQLWRARPNRALLFTLPGIVFLMASNTLAGGLIPWSAPLYLLALMLTLPQHRAAPTPHPRAPRLVLVGVALLAATLAVGGFINHEVYKHRAGLYALGERLMGLHEPDIAGASFDPSLGDTFGLRGSPRRMLRLTGYRQPLYLRAMSFDTYDHGLWLPRADARGMMLIYKQGATPLMPGQRVRVTPLTPEARQVIYLPLRAAGLIADAPPQWAPQDGGPVEGSSTSWHTYDFALGRPGDPTLWPAPDDAHRAAMLTVPREIDPRVRALAQRVAAQAKTTTEKVYAVSDYLMLHYPYRTSFRAGAGDPVSRFLLGRQGAHCKNFAAGATMMLRCLGVPTRYVVGYFAHEAHAGGLLVRQRDAHAWAEAWVPERGWVTVDATPGGGRPDRSEEGRPGWWLVAWEMVQDLFARGQAWITTLSPLQLFGLVAVVIVPFFLWQIWSARRVRAHGAVTEGYATPDAALVACAARFSAWLARAGAPCPEHRPWAEHVARHRLPQAAAFVDAYNAARFGAPTADAADALAALLTELDRAPLPAAAPE